ncbi:MAG: flagellar basal body P-ring formation chaperone FlgA [Vicinamibacterales bacterium]
MKIATLTVATIVLALAGVPSAADLRAGAGPAQGGRAVETAAVGSAAAVIRAALVERLGRGAIITVSAVDGARDGVVYREARPDPSGWLGKPVRFTLIPETGGAHLATASVRVVVDHAVATHAITRGATLADDDVEAVRSELTGTPIRAVPTAEAVTGGRALRPIPEGAVVLNGFVAIPRAVEPGDRVTVVAAVGAVQVTAAFVAADGGRPGDVIRCMNPDTRHYVRGRIVRKGLVEVIYER